MVALIMTGKQILPDTTKPRLLPWFSAERPRIL